MKIVEYMWVNIRPMLIAPAKIPEQKGSVWVGYCLQVWNKGEGGGGGGERYYGEVGAVYLSGQRYRLKVRSVVQGYVGGLLRLGGEPGWCSYKNLLENGSF